MSNYIGALALVCLASSANAIAIEAKLSCQDKAGHYSKILDSFKKGAKPRYSTNDIVNDYIEDYIEKPLVTKDWNYEENCHDTLRKY